MTSEYSAHFPNGRVIADIGPNYYDRPNIFDSSLYGVRLIFMLRDPIDRMISHMRHLSQRVRPPVVHPTYRSFIDLQEVHELACTRELEWSHEVVRRSLYDVFIPHWSAFTGPRLILSMHDLEQDQEAVWARVCDFLDIERWMPESPIHEHKTAFTDRVIVTLDDQLRTYFKGIFRPTSRWVKDELGLRL